MSAQMILDGEVAWEKYKEIWSAFQESPTREGLEDTNEAYAAWTASYCGTYTEESRGRMIATNRLALLRHLEGRAPAVAA